MHKSKKYIKKKKKKKMLSIFYKIFELETPQSVSVDIFKPNKEKQIILMKGKLGQYKLNWSCCSHTKGSLWLKIEEKIKEINNENKKQEDITNLLKGSIIWTLENEQENIKEEKTEVATDATYATDATDATDATEREEQKKEENNCSLDLRKENKRFIYDQKTNKINEYTYIKKCRATKNVKNNTIFTKIKNNKVQKSAELAPRTEQERSEHEEQKKTEEAKVATLATVATYATDATERAKTAKLQMGYIIPLKKRELLNTNEKIKENEINSIFRKETLEYAYRAEIKNIIKQIKNIIKGINQGFSINLELKGIGYTAKITEDIINKLKSKERDELHPLHTLHPTAEGYEACSENGERAEHEEKKNQKCGAWKENNKNLTNNIGQLESNIKLSNQKNAEEQKNIRNGKKKQNKNA